MKKILLILLLSNIVVSQNYSFKEGEIKGSTLTINFDVLLGDEKVNTKEYVVRVIDFIEKKSDTTKHENKFSIQFNKNCKYRVDVYYKNFGGVSFVLDTDKLDKKTSFEYKVRLYPDVYPYIGNYIFYNPKKGEFQNETLYPMDLWWKKDY